MRGSCQMSFVPVSQARLIALNALSFFTRFSDIHRKKNLIAIIGINKKSFSVRAA